MDTRILPCQLRPSHEAILHITKVSIVLVSICPVNCSRAIVLLLSYSPDISLNLFSILVISYITNLKAPNISYKLSLNNFNYYLLLVSNMQPGNASPSTRLLYTLREPVVSLDLAVFLL